SCPSSRAPRRQTNSAPGSTRRESTAIEAMVTSGLPDRELAPAPAMRCASGLRMWADIYLMPGGNPSRGGSARRRRDERRIGIVDRGARAFGHRALPQEHAARRVADRRCRDYAAVIGPDGPVHFDEYDVLRLVGRHDPDE